MNRSTRLLFARLAALLLLLPIVADAQTPAASNPNVEREDIFQSLLPLSDVPQDEVGRPDFIPPTTHPGAPPDLSPRLRLLLTPEESSPESSPLKAKEFRVPQSVELATLPVAELRILLAHTAAAFGTYLKDIKRGPQWKEYLRLEEIQIYFTEPKAGVSRQAAGERIQLTRLQLILDRYNSIRSQDKYDVVTKQPSFQILRLGLTEYLVPPADRRHRQLLLLGHQQLKQALVPVPTGGQWHQFLELNALHSMATGSWPLSQEERGRAKKFLQRFDYVARAEPFQGVARMPGFAEVHRALRGLEVSGGLSQPPALLNAISNDDEREISSGTGDELAPSLAPLGFTSSRRGRKSGNVRLRLIEGSPQIRASGDEQASPISEATDSLAEGSEVITADEPAKMFIDSLAFHIEPATKFTIGSQTLTSGQGAVTLSISAGSLRLTGGGEKSGPHVIVATENHLLASDGPDFALRIQLDAAQSRAVATAYAGTFHVENFETGDRAALSPNREAVMLPDRISVRTASEQPADWWPKADTPVTSARPGTSNPR